MGQTLKVGVYVSPPFVMTTDGGLYSGMAILLWEKLEHRLGLTSEYVSYTSFQDFLAAPGKGEVDLLLTNLTVTHERAKSLKFSYPWYDGGMRILVSTESPPSLWDGLKRSGQLHAYAWMAGILVLLTALHTLIHRRLLHDFPDRWLDGFSLSLYELTQNVRGNVNLKSMEYLGWFKHVLGAVWMLCGVAVVAYITSSVTSTMTASSLQQSSISSLADLKDKKTAVLQGSAGEEYLRKLNLRVVPQPNLEAAIAALREKKVEAVATDTSVLEYWANTHPDARVAVVGSLFHPHKFAFASSKKRGDLMDRISVELIHLHEQGIIEDLRRKYIGPDH